MRRTRRRRRRRRVLLVGGLVAFGAYKMTQRDADRIQQYTGVEPEEMTDEELARAMDDLGIEKQTVTAEDREQASGGATPPPAGGEMSDLDELQKLADLHAQGILTDEEFAAKKAQILDL
ncbi:MAG: SHOCT domain-containing protein [Acidimicrobiia bacterium]|nr:SHOCT domain-containing protein [Acidimicrobiia bacterium]